MSEKRSDAITKGFERTPHRALLKSTGVPNEQMDKPFIGIASSFTDLIPGHTGMRDLERFIEKGIHSGGGSSFIFGIPGVGRLAVDAIFLRDYGVLQASIIYKS